MWSEATVNDDDVQMVGIAGVIEVGQGFVDELVRVWPSQHPGTTIIPVRMNRAVEAMVRRGLPRRPEG